MKNGELITTWLDYCAETSRLIRDGTVSGAQAALARVEADHSTELYRACLDNGWTQQELDAAFERRFDFRVNRGG